MSPCVPFPCPSPPLSRTLSRLPNEQQLSDSTPLTAVVLAVRLCLPRNSCTTDPRRRLRQHNGEIGHGARHTKAKRPWEMALCVYGFPSHVEALKFEWAWQHPFESIAVREVAAKLPPFKGVNGMVTLVCTMVTLPKWSSVSLTLQFMTSDLLQHRYGSPQLPPQMRVIVAPMQDLPGRDSLNDNEDQDNTSQSRPWDGESDSDHTRKIAAEMTATTGRLDEGTSPTVRPKGKKSRKGKTPQGRKGKRAGVHRPSVDPILLELRAMGSGARTSFAMTEGSSQELSELTVDCSLRSEMSLNCGVQSRGSLDWTVQNDSTMTVTVGEPCRSSRSRQEGACEASLNLSTLSIRERILLFRGSGTELLEADLCFSGSDSENVGGTTASRETAANEPAFAYSASEDRLLDSGEAPEIDLSGSSLKETYVSIVTSGDKQGMKMGGNEGCDGHAKPWSSLSEDTSSGFHEGEPSSGRLAKDHRAAKPASHDGASRIDLGSSKAGGVNSVSEKSLAPKSFAERTRSHGLSGGQSDDISGGLPSGDLPFRHERSSSTGACLAGPPCCRPGERRDPCGGLPALVRSPGEGNPLDGKSGDRSLTCSVQCSFERHGDSILFPLEAKPVTAARQQAIFSDSDVEEISLEEFRPSDYKGASGISYPNSGYDRPATDVQDEISAPSRPPQQKILIDVFPVRKHGAGAQSIYRKARNGETRKVLEDRSKRGNALSDQQTALSSVAGIEQKLKMPSGKIAKSKFVVADGDDDDEIREISAQEFQRLGNSQRKSNVCPLRDLR